MNWLKYKVLVIGGAISLLLAIGAVFGLLRFQGRYSKAASELKAANDSLDRLNRRNPFPSAENVTLMQQNRDKMKEFLASLQADFRKSQVPDEAMEPAQFAPFLETIRRDLIARATAAAVKLPDRMSMGFDRYVAGQLPAAPDIPRLAIQARLAAALAGVMFESKVDELADIERTAFETAPGDPAAAGNPAPRVAMPGVGPSPVLSTLTLPSAESNELYCAERFGISFVAREHAVWEVLNALARSTLFAVVKHVQVANEFNPKTALGKSALPPGAPGAPPPAAGAPAAPAPLIIYPPREERIVAGREGVRVSLVVDVYRFASPAAPEGSP